MGPRKLALKKSAYFAHPTAVISPRARIGRGTKIWAFAQVREGVVIGRDCVIGNGVYVDAGVRLGDRVNVHNKALLYRNLVIEDDVFIGPAVCFINDPSPRANRTRDLKGRRIRVQKGASIGANASVFPETTIGRYAMVGAASLVTRDVPDHALVYGAPAQLRGFVTAKGSKRL